ncbi:hypothetical protein Tco_0559134, partial [Tanacetum coccineum]
GLLDVANERECLGLIIEFMNDESSIEEVEIGDTSKHNEDSREENKVDNGGEENGCESINVDGRTYKKTEIYSNVVQDASLKKAGVKKANANEDKRKKKVDVKGNLLFMVMEMHQVSLFEDYMVFVMRHMETYRGKDNSGDINCLIKDDKEQLRQTSDLRYKYAAKILLANYNMVKSKFE